MTLGTDLVKTIVKVIRQICLDVIHKRMNWQSVRFDWNQLRAFLVTAETGSFSQAARALGLTQPTLGRQVAALEEDLGVTLFERVGRSLSLTEAGRALLAHARRMGEAANDVSLTASGQAETVEGRVVVSAGDIFAARVLPHAALRLRALAPQVELEILASNDLSDLQRREADIAIRHVRPEQPDLIAKLVREDGVRMFAATNYLDRMGRPQTPQDLLQHDFISMRNRAETFRTLTELGIPVSEHRLRAGSESGNVCFELMRLGQGLLPMLNDLANNVPGIEPVLPDFVPFKVPYWLTVHRELHTSRRIRLVYDMLADLFAQKTLPGCERV